MRLLLAALPLALVALSPAQAAESQEPAIEGKPWRGDDDFYGVYVTYSRAELMYRRLRNRICAFDEQKQRSLGWVLKSTRESLDTSRSRIEALWPGGLDEVFDVFANKDKTPVDHCDDPIAASEAHLGALYGRETTEFVLELVERERRAQGEP